MFLLRRGNVRVGKYQIKKSLQLAFVLPILRLDEDIREVKGFSRILPVRVASLFRVSLNQSYCFIFRSVSLDKVVQPLFLCGEDANEKEPIAIDFPEGGHLLGALQRKQYLCSPRLRIWSRSVTGTLGVNIGDSSQCPNILSLRLP